MEAIETDPVTGLAEIATTDATTDLQAQARITVTPGKNRTVRGPHSTAMELEVHQEGVCLVVALDQDLEHFREAVDECTATT